MPGEVVGFCDNRVLVMPIGELDGLGMGCRAIVDKAEARIFSDFGGLGRVVNGLGEPIDGKGPLPRGLAPRPIRAAPPPAHLRARVGGRLDVGVRAINAFTTCYRGQRMGIFAGSGVGKSVLLSMLARNTAADVSVIGLIGERGREVGEFIQDHLGPAGLQRSVVVVATSDEPDLLRHQSAQMTLAIAEFFRDQGLDVFCLMDSVTRFAMAQREIGLSLGEPPAAKGYTPSVFAELPRLLERAGPGPVASGGTIASLFTVLVEGDDHNEPIADAVRGILDGRIVLDCAIAERGRFPAINVLRSLSRTMPGCNDKAETGRILHARRLMTLYDDIAELIRIGAYRKGSDGAVDEADRPPCGPQGLPRAGYARRRRSRKFARGHRSPARSGTGTVRRAPVVSRSLDTLARLARLSGDTAAKQTVYHTDLKPDGYGRVQHILDEGEVFQINERNVMGFLEQDGQIWKAVVKRTGDGAETYLTTLHRAQPRDLVLARHRHKKVQ